MLFVSDINLDCNMVHVPYVRYHNNVTLSNLGKNHPALTNCMPLGFRGSVINQPGKMTENHSSLINGRPQLDAGLEKTPGQNLRILIKRRRHLIEKIL